MIFETISGIKSFAVLGLMFSGGLAVIESQFSAGDVLQGIILAVSGWTLLEVIKLGKKTAQLDQKLQDLPCDNSPSGNCEPGKNRKRTTMQ